jgi:dCMP deaminase
MERPSWDKLFMTMVYLVAFGSKDNRSHLGAVIVGPKNEIRSTGYNGFVRGLDDSREYRQEKPEKYFWFEHAERNAIYNATLMGVSLDGCKMYTNGVPCMDCARGIIQSGIREVIVDKKWNDKNFQKWREHAERSLEMFDEVGVRLRYYDGSLLNIYKFQHREIIPL